MAEIGIKIVSYSNIAAVVKILRGFTTKSISEIKSAIENKEYVFEGSSYEDVDLEKLVDCYKKLEMADIDSELYEDGRMISPEILLNFQQRNAEIQNEIDAETELELNDTDLEEIEPFSYLWTDEQDDWVVIKDENDYTIFNKQTQGVLLIEDADLNNKVAAMMIMAGCEVFSGVMEWPYENHSEEDYYNAVDFVEKYAESLGAKFICTKEEKFNTYSGAGHILEVNEMRVYQYNDEYFWIEDHFLEDKPFMVFSFGDTIDSIFEDAEPFPYDLSEEELKAEVRYSLGIEPYPKPKNGGVHCL